MKKTNKLLAGLLSLAMLLPAVPTAMAEDTQEWESHEGYLYYETFDNDTYDKVFDVDEQTGRWSNSVSNGKMIYTANPEVTETAYPWIGSKDGGHTIYNFTNNKGKYEVGLTVDLSGFTNGAFNVMTAINANLPLLIQSSGTYKFDGTDISGLKGNYIDKTKPVKMRYLIDLEAGTVTPYVTYTKWGEQTETEFESSSSFGTTNGHYGINLRIQEDKSNRLVGTAEGSFAIDEFYVKELVPYTVTFESFDGSEIEVEGADYADGKYTKEVLDGNIVGGLPIAIKKGYEFDTWYTEASCENEYVPGSIKGRDFTLYAKFTGDGTIASPDSEVPTKDGYLFYEDFNDLTYYEKFMIVDQTGRWRNKVENGKMLYIPNADANAKDITFDSLYTFEADKKYEVGMTVDLSNFKGAFFNLFAGTGLNFPLMEPTGDGFVLTGTFPTTRTSINKAYPVKLLYIVDRTTGALKTEVYITYVPAGQTAETTINGSTNSTIGNVYLKLTDRAAASGSIAIDDFYVKYPEKGADVTFIWGDGADDRRTESAIMGAVAVPAPTKEGYTLLGWSSQPNKTTAADVDFVNEDIKENATVYAVWAENLAVNFYEDNTLTNLITTATGTAGTIKTPANPVNEEKGEFAGWYYIKEGTEVEFDLDNFENGINVYAKWNQREWLTKEGYVFYETFDNDIYASSFNVTDTTGRWKNSVSDGKLLYTAVDGVANTYPWQEGNNGHTIYTLPQGSKYEVGITVDFSNFSNELFNVMPGWNANYPLFNTSGDSFRFDGTDIGGSNGTVIDKTKPVKIVYIIDRVSDTKTGTVYVTYTKSGATAETLTSGTYTPQNNNIALRIWNNGTAKGSLAIDEFYVKEYKDTDAVITLKYNDGATADKTINTKVAAFVTLPTPEREGYVFKGWYTEATGGDKVETILQVTGTATLYAQYVGDSHSVVTFNAAGGTVTTETLNATNGVLEGELPIPQWEGETFLGWYIDNDNNGAYSSGDTEFDVNAVPEGNVTAVARWAVTMTVTFNENNDDNFTSDEADKITTQTIGEGQSFASLPTPARTGYLFDGWKTAEDKDFTTDSVVENNITVYAVWSPAVKVSFNPDGGSTVPDVYASREGKITLPANPTKTGYIFDGWYDGNNKVDANTIFEADTTVVAHWIDGWVVTLDYGYTQELVTLAQGENVTYKVPAAPTRQHYTFEGWTLAGEVVEPGTTVSITGNTTILASWSVPTTDIFSEDFEGETYKNGFDVLPAAADRWSAEVVTKDGKKMMEYTRGADLKYGTVTDTRLSTTLDPETWYEYSYKVYPNGTPLDAAILRMTISFTRFGIGTSMYGLSGDSKGNLVVDGKTYNVQVSDLEYIDVTTRFNMHGEAVNPETKSGECYYDGTMMTSVTYKLMGAEEEITLPSETKTITSGTGHSTQINCNIVALAAGPVGSSGQQGDKFYIDDVALRIVDRTGTASFVTNVDGIEIADKAIYGGKISDIPEVPVDGFDGWFTKNGTIDGDWGEEFVDGGIVGDITLYAKILPTKTVSFYESAEDFAEGNVYYTDSCTRGTIEMPTEEPTNSTYIFQGWYVADEDGNATAVKFDGTGVETDMVIVAKWGNEYFFEDFEGETYLSGLDAPGTRWLSRIGGDGTNSYLEYYPADLTQDGGHIFAHSIGQELKMNGEYEFGYKFDVNTTAYFGMQGLELKGAYGATTYRGIWETTSGDTLTLTGGLDENGAAKKVSIIRDNVEGMISVKYQFNTYTGADSDAGAVTAYISYYDSANKKQVKETVYFANFDPNTCNTLAGLVCTEAVKEGWTVLDTDNIIFDDMYLIVKPAAKVVTFDSNGGTEVLSVEADPNGVIKLPTAPTKEDGSVFAGWFADKELKIPFDGTTAYEDMTVYARWQKAPQVESTNVDSTVSNMPEITVKFDSELDSTTVKKSTIKVMRDGNELDKSAYEIVYSINADTRNSIVTVKFNYELDYDAEYEVLVTTGVANAAGNMAEAYNAKFRTEKMWLVTDGWRVINAANGEEVTSVDNIGGLKLTIKYNVTLGEN